MDSSSSSSSTQLPDFDYFFKLLLIDDSSVGKSSLFRWLGTDESFEAIGLNFKVKMLTVDNKKLKLLIWDTATAGQERFRTLTSSYYRGTHGIIMVYDVTRRDTFKNLSDIWAKELDLYSTNKDCIRMLVGNKVDKESKRAVTREEGIKFAREYGCLFLECSTNTKVNVENCFEELVLKIMDTPSLLADASSGAKNIIKQKAPEADTDVGRSVPPNRSVRFFRSLANFGCPKTSTDRSIAFKVTEASVSRSIGSVFCPKPNVNGLGGLLE